MSNEIKLTNTPSQSNGIKLTNAPVQNIGVNNSNAIVSGSTDHNKLKNRDLADQHPISAITGLQEELDSLNQGVIYTPSVSTEGVISWTNNGGLENPESVNIKGVKGDKGDKGDTGAKGAQGVSGVYIGVGDMPDGYNVQIDPNGATTEIDDLKNDLNNHRGQIRNYPQRTFVNRITDFVQGLRHNQPGAVVKNDADYIVTDSLISFSKGDILHAKTDFNFFLVNTDGSFYKTWINKDLVFTEPKNVYIEIRHSSGKTSLGDVDYIEQEIQSDCVNIIDDIASVKDTMDSFNHSFEEIHKYGDSDIMQGYHVINGTETETSQPLDCTGFIECKSGDVFLFLYLQSISKYGTKKEFISNIGCSALPLYSGNERWNMWVCDFDGYIRCSMWRDETIKYAVTKLNSEPYECVCLGDSIFGNRQKPFDIPTHIQSITKMKTANCAFGGTRASTHSINIYTPLSFWKIADAIYTDDWSEIDVDWNAIANDNVFMVNKKILVNMVDWSKVRVLTVAYGTNDFTGGNAIDNESDKYDCSTYKGALRYGIERILSKYPNITIILLSPLFRYWSNSSDYSTVDEDSDTKLLNGHLLHDFVDAMKAVADEYHLPFFNNYDNLGMNKFNAHSYLIDGTHPSYYDGCEKIGVKIGYEVASVFNRE